MLNHFDTERHHYLVDGRRIPSVTQVLVDEGFIDTFWFTEESRNRGTIAHGQIASHACGAGCAYSPYVEGFIKFQKECDWKPRVVEVPIFGRLFAGTPDQLGLMNGYEGVLDVKTGLICPATGLQLAGYEDLSGKKLRRFALQINGEGKYKLTEYKDKGDSYIFKSAVAIWWWRRNNGIVREKMQ